MDKRDLEEKLGRIAADSSLVSNLSLALARRFASSAFAAVIVIALNFRLESCRDVCLPLAGPAPAARGAARSLMAGIFVTPDKEAGPRRLRADRRFLALCAYYLSRAAREAGESGLSGLVARKAAEFRGCLTPAGTGAVAPLILDRELQRLYFNRYYVYETDCAAFILASLNRPVPRPRDLERDLDLLGYARAEPEDPQRTAVRNCFLNRFAVICGGPGTGKTTTVTRLLLLLTARDPSLRIALAAPTGKAAGRLAQSVAQQKEEIRRDPRLMASLDRLAGSGSDGGAQRLLRLIPGDAVTVHRLLRVRPHDAVPYYNSARRLPCGALIIDEVSMLDLPLFHKICAALAPEARLILLGDRNQLSSVEAGAVLAEICACAGGGTDFVTELKHGYRFSAPIAALASLVNSGRCAEIVGKLRSGVLVEERFRPLAPLFSRGLSDPPALKWEKTAVLPRTVADAALAPAEPQGTCGSLLAFCEFIRDKTRYGRHGLGREEVGEAFSLLSRFRVLCSNRRGPLGLDSLNRLLARGAELRVCGRAAGREFFPGLVVMVTRNNPRLRLSNGDIGFCAPDTDGALRVFFEEENGEERKINPLFIGPYELGYAITIHKAQGSEYDSVALVISPEDNPVLTRELIYTGITRARKGVTLYCTEEILEASCGRGIERTGGLKLRLEQGLARPPGPLPENHRSQP